MLRNTQEKLIAMKKNILDACVSRRMKCMDGAKTLSMHPKSFSRLKSNYVKYGENILVPKKTGSKKGKPPKNRTPDIIENMVCNLALDNKNSGPVDLDDDLFDIYGIKLDQSTVFRILKRKRIRYSKNYLKIGREKPKLYCLEKPGQEVQLDACFPFGRV